MDTEDTAQVLLRYADLPKAIRFSRPYLDKMARRGEFPQPVKIGRRAIAWRADEIEEFIATRARRG